MCYANIRDKVWYSQNQVCNILLYPESSLFRCFVCTCNYLNGTEQQ